MASVQIRSFSGPNTGKCGPEKTPYLDSFHSVKGHQIDITRVIMVFAVLTSNNKLPAFPSTFMVKFNLFLPIGFSIRKHLFKVNNRKNIEASLDVILVSLLFDTKLPVYIYLFKVISKNTRKRCEICSRLTIKTSERHRWRRFVFIINFAHISHLFLVFLSVTLNK